MQQDCYAVDIRCIAVRPDLIDAFERVTGIKYVNTFDNASGHSQDGSSAPDERFSGLSEEEIIKLSISFGEEIRRRSLRTVWDPKAVLRVL